MRSLLGRFHRPMSRGLVNNMLTMNNLGDGSTLSLDFTTMGGVLDPRLTFTRSTTATYINSSGYVTSAAINAPRFDYSPTNIGEPRGLLVEGQGVNACSYSEDFANAAWTKSGIAQTPASGTSPDNSNNATLIAENAGGFIKHSLERSVTVTAGSVYTWSVFLKEASSNSRRYACVQVADGQAIAARNTVVFDLQTGTVTANGVNNGTAGAPTDVAHSITSYRDGWYRVSVTMKYVASPCYPAILLSDISTLFGGSNQPFYTATVPYKSLLVYGGQLELGSGASSYIPTGASQVTRNAENCYMSDISSLSYSATNGSMVYEGLFFQINSLSYPTRMGFLTAAGGDPAFEIFVNGTTIFSGIRSVPANNEITRTIATNTNYKFATSFNAAASSQVRCSINGAAVVGSGSSALTATRTPTVFGFTRSGYELYFPSGTIKSAKYWNTTLTDADLVSKST